MRYLLLFMCLCMFQFFARASHVPGGNITYECIGPNEFVITFTMFEDCGTAFEGNGVQTINVANDCGFSTPSQITLDNLVYREEVSQLCASQLPFSECSGGTQPGIYMHQWSDTIVLPGECDSWTFSYSSCCRNASENLVGASNGIYFETVLNSETAPCNTSPEVTTQMIPYVCVNQPLTYNLGVYEPDGNTMQYSLVNSLTGAGASVPYVAPYTGAIPMSGMTINSVTGDLNFTPTMVGNWVVSVLVEEFDDNGDLVGSIIQDFQFEVINCPNNTNPVEPTGITNYVGDGSLIAPNEIEMCGGESFCFDIEFTDLNSTDSIYINSNIDIALPGATLIQTSWFSPATATVCWTAGNTVPSPTSVVFSARDNACPIFGMSFYPVIVRVIRSTYAGPDQIICNGDSAVINVTGGTQFQWESFVGGDTIMVGTNFTCDTCADVEASPIITTTYEVTSDLSGGCVNKDTVTINVVSDFSYIMNQDATTSCLNEDIQININPNQTGTYIYDWEDNGLLNDATIANPIFSSSVPGMYEFPVTIEGPSGCVKYDTAFISTSSFSAPQFNAVIGPINVDCGDTVYLDAELISTSPVLCGPSATTICESTPVGYTEGVAAGSNTSTTYPSPFGNWYRNARHQFYYPASELLAAGLTGGKISGLEWEVTQLNGTDLYNDYTIEMGCASGGFSSSGSGSVASWITGLTQVFTPQNIQIVQGTNTLDFTTAYEWDGLSDIVIDVCYNNLSSNYTQNSETPWVNSAYTSALFFRSDAQIACGGGTPTASNNRPVTTFKWCSSEIDPSNYTFEWLGSATIDDANDSTTFDVPFVDTEYDIVVTNLNGNCTDTISGTVTVNCCDSPIPTVSDLTCFQSNDGEIHVQPVSGVGGPYTIELVNPNTSMVLQSENNVLTDVTFFNLTSGDYLITFEDPTGCTADTLVSLLEPNVVIAQLPNDTTICENDTLTILAQGGLNYNWEASVQLEFSSGAMNTFYSNITELIYVEAFDVNGCSGRDSMLVSVNANPSLILSSDTIICLNDTINIQATGANDYTWMFTSNISDITVGNPDVYPNSDTYYVVEGSSLEGCVTTDSILVQVQELPSVSAGIDQELCIGDTVQLDGSGALVYSWNAISEIDNASIEDPLVWPVIATEYVLMGEDALGCINYDTTVVIVNDLPMVDAGEDVWVCPGSDYQLNGVGVGTVSWNSLSVVSDPSILNPITSPVDTSLYVLEIMDVNGCLNSDMVELIVNQFVPTEAGQDTTICEGDTVLIGNSGGSIFATSFNWTPVHSILDNSLEEISVYPIENTWYYLETTNDTCSGIDSVLVSVNPYPMVNAGADIQVCTGDTVQLNASGGVDYFWLNPSDISNPLIFNPEVFPSDTTEYIVQVTDVNGCVQTDSVNVLVNPLPEIMISGIDEICLGDTAQLYAVGGITYLWSETTLIDDFNIANPEIWIENSEFVGVQVVDSNFCANTDSIFVTVNSLPLVDAGVDDYICIGDSTQLNASGALTYDWIVYNNISDPMINNPFVYSEVDTLYVVQGTDVNGCVNSDTIFIEVKPLPIIFAGGDEQLCIGDSLQLQATGADTYTWDNSAVMNDETISNPLVFPDDTTEFIVVGTDAFGCSNTDSMVVDVNPLPTVTISQDQNICRGDSVTISASGGENYLWYPNMWISDSQVAIPEVYPDTSMTYVVAVIDSNGCVNSDSMLVNVFRIETIDDTVICFTDSVQLDVYGAPGVQFEWTPTAGLSNPFVDNPIAMPDTSTIYFVSVTDNQGCEDQANVEINVNPIPVPSFEFDSEPSCSGLYFNFDDNSINADDYSWDFGNGIVLYDESPEITLGYNTSNVLNLTLVNSYGCSADTSTSLVVDDFDSYYDIRIPNVFTPNGDGQNDVFWIETPGQLSQCLMVRIFNRWGQEIFKSAGSIIAWDGRSTTGDEMTNGTYLFTIEIEDYTYHGALNLFR